VRSQLDSLTPEVEKAVAADSCTALSRIKAAAMAMTLAAMHADMKLRTGTSSFQRFNSTSALYAFRGATTAAPPQ
jgi:hypothetical protein